MNTIYIHNFIYKMLLCCICSIRRQPGMKARFFLFTKTSHYHQEKYILVFYINNI